MKKIYLIFAIMAFLSYAGVSQTLTWRFANFEVINAGTQLKFDVQVKGDVSTTYHRDLQVYFDYNPAGFGSSLVSNGHITVTPSGLLANHYSIVNVVDNTTSKIAVITEANNELSLVGGSSGFNLMPSSFTNLFEVVMDITDNTATAGIAFDPSLMNGGQYYQSTSAVEPVKYNDPCVYANDYNSNKLSTVYGNITYANSSNSALSDVTVKLMQGATQVGTDVSDANGQYNISSINDASYTLESSTTKAWGGLNVADIFLTKMKAAGQNPPGWVPVMGDLAADVTADGSVNIADVFMMQMKNAGNTPPGWNADDYIFPVQNVTVSGGVGNKDYQGICAGDVNGSYIPPVK